MAKDINQKVDLFKGFLGRKVVLSSCIPTSVVLQGLVLLGYQSVTTTKGSVNILVLQSFCFLLCECAMLYMYSLLLFGQYHHPLQKKGGL